MLSQARQKKKWSVDPRNSAWSNDQDRYGVKMMKKMGWNTDRGLGKKEDGNKNHVKVQHKADNKGLGCSLSYEKNWVAHQDDFSSLLNQLNSHSQTLHEDFKGPNIAVTNLEKQSKSQKLLHYNKFSKGKNLSLYKQEDMSAIFGTTAKLVPVTVAASKTDDCSKDASALVKTKSAHKRKSNTTPEDFTVNSQYSIQEYFKMRQAALPCVLAKNGDTAAHKKDTLCQKTYEMFEGALSECGNEASIKLDHKPKRKKKCSQKKKC